jgi:hypothetical protein
VIARQALVVTGAAVLAVSSLVIAGPVAAIVVIGVAGVLLVVAVAAGWL